MNLSDLRKPFREDEIEWRLSRCGKTQEGKIWATCLAYVSARAIMDRLDEVCGPSQWRVSYRFVSAASGAFSGFVCELGIRVGESWIVKEDGAEQTDIEPFKGGISSALKRAGSVWGMGRYLYRLEEGFAKIVPDRKGAFYGKTKEGISFFWVPPPLPAWALPEGNVSSEAPQVTAPNSILGIVIKPKENAKPTVSPAPPYEEDTNSWEDLGEPPSWVK